MWWLKQKSISQRFELCICLLRKFAAEVGCAQGATGAHQPSWGALFLLFTRSSGQVVKKAFDHCKFTPCANRVALAVSPPNYLHGFTTRGHPSASASYPHLRILNSFNYSSISRPDWGPTKKRLSPFSRQGPEFRPPQSTT